MREKGDGRALSCSSMVKLPPQRSNPEQIVWSAPDLLLPDWAPRWVQGKGSEDQLRMHKMAAMACPTSPKDWRTTKAMRGIHEPRHCQNTSGGGGGKLAITPKDKVDLGP